MGIHHRTRWAAAAGISVVAISMASLGGVPALASSGGAGPASSIAATSQGFAGYRTPVPAAAATQAVVPVVTTGTCGAGIFESVATGAEQAGTGGLLGARVYSQCLGGTPVVSAMFETASGPVPMTSIGALAPGDVIAIWISTTSGTTTVTVQGPLGSDTMTVPDVVSSKYRVGLWPLFDTHSQAKMQNFGVLTSYKNTVNTTPIGTWPKTRVHLVYTSGIQRAKTSHLNPYGDTFKVKWINP